MTLYNFIKISNNNNSTKDFDIIITKIKNDRLKMSSLKSQYFRHLDNPNYYPHRNIYRFFNLDYSFYKLDRQEFVDIDTAKIHRENLLKEQYEKMNKIEKIAPQSIIQDIAGNYIVKF
jgi:hypothetical protein